MIWTKDSGCCLLAPYWRQYKNPAQSWFLQSISQCENDCVPMFRIYQLSLCHGIVSKRGTLVSILYQVQTDLASPFVYIHTFIILYSLAHFQLIHLRSTAIPFLPVFVSRGCLLCCSSQSSLVSRHYGVSIETNPVENVEMSVIR